VIGHFCGSDLPNAGQLASLKRKEKTFYNVHWLKIVLLSVTNDKYDITVGSGKAFHLLNPLSIFFILGVGVGVSVLGVSFCSMISVGYQLSGGFGLSVL
jgi:hypothetical protein